MKKYSVRLTDEAEYDLVDIHVFVARQTSPEHADELLDELEQVCHTLSRLPNRGHMPPELERIGVLDFREIHHQRYRIVYEVVSDQVFVHCILDSRRNMQALLERRLIR